MPTNLMLQEKKVGALEHIGDEVGSWSNGKINVKGYAREPSGSCGAFLKSLILCGDLGRTCSKNGEKHEKYMK